VPTHISSVSTAAIRMIVGRQVSDGWTLHHLVGEHGYRFLCPNVVVLYKKNQAGIDEASSV